MKTFEDGVYLGVPEADYHSASGLSASMMKHLEKSPAHLKVYMETAQAKKTSAKLLGSIVHHLVLQPNVKPFWAVMPEGLNGRTREGKAWKEMHSGLEVIDDADGRLVDGMVSAIRNHPEASLALAVGKPEVSMFASISLSQRAGDLPVAFQRKGRIDFVNDGPSLVDIKTTEDAREDSFAAAVYSYRYYRQAAYYLDTWNELNPDNQKEFFVFIAVEKEPPHGVVVYELDNEALVKGRVEYQALMRKYAECLSAQRWPCYAHGLKKLKLPRWAWMEKNICLD